MLNYTFQLNEFTALTFINLNDYLKFILAGIQQYVVAGLIVAFSEYMRDIQFANLIVDFSDEIAMDSYEELTAAAALMEISKVKPEILNSHGGFFKRINKKTSINLKKKMRKTQKRKRVNRKTCKKSISRKSIAK